MKTEKESCWWKEDQTEKEEEHHFRGGEEGEKKTAEEADRTLTGRPPCNVNSLFAVAVVTAP